MFMTSPANLVTLNLFFEIVGTEEMVINWARIFIPYNPNSIPVENRDLEDRLKLYTWSEEDKNWEGTDHTGVDLNNKIVFGNVSHLSIFAPMAEPAPADEDSDETAIGTTVVIFLTIIIPVIFVVFILFTRKRAGTLRIRREGRNDDIDEESEE
jgi:hypothetical protein